MHTCLLIHKRIQLAWLMFLWIFVGLAGVVQAQDIEYVVPYEDQTSKTGWTIANIPDKKNASFVNYGCYVTSIWMARRAAGLYSQDLKTFNNLLQTEGLCVRTGKSADIGTINSKGRQFFGISGAGNSQAALDEILKDRPVIIKTGYKVATGDHFYVVTGKKGDKYVCNDPVKWKGTTTGEGQLRPYRDLSLREIRDMREIAGRVPKKGGQGNKVYRVNLKSNDGKGYFLCAEDGGGREVNSSRTAASTWEEFTIADLNGGTLDHDDGITIRSLNGKYLCSENGGINANRSSVGEPNEKLQIGKNWVSWERFRIKQANGYAPIKSGDLIVLQVYNGAIWQADGKRLYTKNCPVGAWERFKITILGTYVK